ncbi:ankyrin repeat domain-containing protein [Candidatus Pacearchaeota archaeon]|nr:ankyrin repeat domain-containing protein [Candidatus Pacearchaeota archaeon]
MKGRIINYLKSIGINADGIKEYKKDEIFVYIGNARIEFIKGTENGIYSIRWIGIEPPKKIPSKIFYMDFNKELVLFWEKDGNLHRKNAEPATLSFNMQTGKLTSYSFFEDGKVVPVNATQEDIQRNYEFLFEEYRNLLRYIFNGKGEIKQKKTQEPKRNQIDMIELDEVRRRIKLLKEDRNLDLELMDAAKKGDLDKVKNLIEQGADIHAERDHALRIAAKRGYFDIVKYLVEHGADIHAVNDCTLRLAVENGDLDMVKYLVEHGADIHVFKEGPLFWAVKYGYLDIVKYLVEMVLIFMFLIIML